MSYIFPVLLYFIFSSCTLHPRPFADKSCTQPMGVRHFVWENYLQFLSLLDHEMIVVYWWKLSINENCLLMKVVYWWKLSIDECCILMSVVYWWKSKIQKFVMKEGDWLFRRYKERDKGISERIKGEASRLSMAHCLGKPDLFCCFFQRSLNIINVIISI